MNLHVYPDNRVVCNGKEYECVLGKKGITAAKKEGDLATPAGIFPVQAVYYRADRVAKPKTDLPVRAINLQDGWCDDEKDINYNKFVVLPYAARHEKLWREDSVYNLLCVVEYNRNPIIAGAGSAIFLHLMRENKEGTEGCVAFKEADFREILAQLNPASLVCVHQK